VKYLCCERKLAKQLPQDVLPTMHIGEKVLASLSSKQKTYLGLRVKLPKFLTPRRKYEVNESMRLVKFGRPKVEMLVRIGRRSIPVLQSTEKELLIQIKRLGPVAHSTRIVLAHEARKPILFLQWHRMPKDWELSFVTKMKSAESQGIPFTEVLQTNLPMVLGQVPSDVLLRWVGRRARSQPKRFVNTINGMFGKSGKKIIVGLQDALDPAKMLEVEEPSEEKFQSLIDAIQQADASNSIPLKFLDKDRWKNFTGQ